MPDNWETDNGLNPDDDSDGNGIGAEGYTNLEIYLNSLVTGCDPEPVSGVGVSPVTATVDINAATQLTPIIAPYCAGNKKVSWSSSDTTIATVSSSGLVTGVAEGSASITLTTEEGGFTATSDISVSDPTLAKTERSGHGIDIYPMPFKDRLHIQFQSEPAEEVYICLLDDTGRVLRYEKAVGLNHQLDVADLNEGLYLVRITGVSINAVRSVVKTR
jgi:hypothetical protein